MQELNMIQEYVESTARNVRREVLRTYEALEQLAALSLTLLQDVPNSQAEVDACSPCANV